MWRSLKRVLPTASLHVLCLNDRCHGAMASLELPDVYLHALTDVETADVNLVQARQNRSAVEYYFTLTPCLPLHVFRTHPSIPRVTYVDADLFFFASPQPIFDEIGDSAVAIIEHRFSDRLPNRERFGRFNVGWLTFRHDPAALDCLQQWRAQCLEWCFDRLETDRFAEQKYLDAWPGRVERLCIVQHRGANVAPWNLDRFALAVEDDRLTVGGDPLIFFHAHGFQPAGPSRPRNNNLHEHGVVETPLIHERVFAPYERALFDAVSSIAAPLALSLLTDRPREEELRIEAIQERLSSSERERDAGLAANQRLQARLNMLEAELAQTDAAMAHLQRSEEAERRRTEALQSSMSWKLTAPLRVVAGLFGIRGRG